MPKKSELFQLASLFSGASTALAGGRRGAGTQLSEILGPAIEQAQRQEFEKEEKKRKKNAKTNKVIDIATKSIPIPIVKAAVRTGAREAFNSAEGSTLQIAGREALASGVVGQALASDKFAQVSEKIGGTLGNLFGGQQTNAGPGAGTPFLAGGGKTFAGAGGRAKGRIIGKRIGGILGSIGGGGSIDPSFSVQGGPLMGQGRFGRVLSSIGGGEGSTEGALSNLGGGRLSEIASILGVGEEEVPSRFIPSGLGLSQGQVARINNENLQREESTADRRLRATSEANRSTEFNKRLSQDLKIEEDNRSFEERMVKLGISEGNRKRIVDIEDEADLRAILSTEAKAEGTDPASQRGFASDIREENRVNAITLRGTPTGQTQQQVEDAAARRGNVDLQRTLLEGNIKRAVPEAEQAALSRAMKQAGETAPVDALGLPDTSNILRDAIGLLKATPDSVSPTTIQNLENLLPKTEPFTPGGTRIGGAAVTVTGEPGTPPPQVEPALETPTRESLAGGNLVPDAILAANNEAKSIIRQKLIALKRQRATPPEGLADNETAKGRIRKEITRLEQKSKKLDSLESVMAKLDNISAKGLQMIFIREIRDIVKIADEILGSQ